MLMLSYLELLACDSNHVFCLLIDSGTFSTSKQANCLRLFELQSVSAETLRIVLDQMPKPFEDKIRDFCGSPKNSKRKKDFLPGICIYANFNFIDVNTFF